MMEQSTQNKTIPSQLARRFNAIVTQYKFHLGLYAAKPKQHTLRKTMIESTKYFTHHFHWKLVKLTEKFSVQTRELSARSFALHLFSIYGKKTYPHRKNWVLVICPIKCDVRKTDLCLKFQHKDRVFLMNNSTWFSRYVLKYLALLRICFGTIWL